MHKVVKIIFITFLSLSAIAFLISIYLGIKAILPEEDRQTVVTREVLEYLNERYNEEFEIINFIPPSFNYASYIITAVRKGDPKDVEHWVTIHGWVSKEKKLFKKNKVTFYDNYMAVKFIPDLKKRVTNLVLEDYSECKIHLKFDKEWIQKNANIYASVEEFLEKDEYWKNSMEIKIFVYTKNLENKKMLKDYSKKIFEKLVDNQFKGSARCLFIKNYDTYTDLEDTFHIYDWMTDTSKGLGECGEDYVYSDCILKNNQKLNINFDDKP
ncbi:MAG: hypothetical protein J6D02_12355 [Lachnospira sp.]|nr:hypothetical protein [Lachnospira sp.]